MVKRPNKPSFAGLKCQIRPAAIRLRKLMRMRPTPLDQALYNAAVTPKPLLDQLRLIELSSLESIVHGTAKWTDVQRLADACNIGHTLCKDFNVGKADALPSILAAEHAIIQVAARMERTGGKIGLSATELQSIRDALEWTHAQREVVSRKTLLRAIDMTRARIAGDHDVVDLNQACSFINQRAA